MAKSNKKAAPAQATFALLDRNGLLLGYKVMTLEAAADRHDTIRVPDDCDLVPERYRWHREHGRFDPIPPAPPHSPDLAPDALRAIWKGFKALQDQLGIELPEETRAWLAEYGKTIDARG